MTGSKKKTYCVHLESGLNSGTGEPEGLVL